MITQQTITEQLRDAKPYLQSKYHLASLGLFGSVIRNDFTPRSDVDILVDFTTPIGVEFIDLPLELELLLKRKVDLVSRNGIKMKYLAAIQLEIQYV